MNAIGVFEDDTHIFKCGLFIEAPAFPFNFRTPEPETLGREVLFSGKGNSPLKVSR